MGTPDNSIMKKSRIYDRIWITNNENFTIPDTASLFCSGGGIFRNGIAVGSNNSIIPGSIRFDDNKLQYLRNEGWLNISGLYKNSDNKENSIVTVGNDDELKSTDILIEDKDISGINTLETEYVVPPEDKSLKLGSIEWPEIPGNTNHSLRFVSPGVLISSLDPMPVYSSNSETNKILFFEDTNGKLNSSDINVSGKNLSNIEELSGNGKISLTNTLNSEKITFGVSPPLNSTSPGEKGDFSFDSDYIYVCTSANTWKRTPLSSW